jgi:hypothetical protein
VEQSVCTTLPKHGAGSVYYPFVALDDANDCVELISQTWQDFWGDAKEGQAKDVD